MEPGMIGLFGFIIMVVLVCSGIPLAFAIATAGLVGTSVLIGLSQSSLQLYQITFHTTTDFLLTSIPMFIFMGQLVSSGDLGRDMFDCVYKWVGWLPGGLAVTNVISCAGIGAISGISAAGIGSIAPVAIPQMKRYHYDSKLAAGSLSASSTLAILIPPSLAFVVYGIYTDTSIGQLFIAGILPGILLAGAFCIYIILSCVWNPRLGPVGPSFTWSERLRSLASVVPIFVIFGILIGGLYLGWFTPSEGAAVGCSSVAAVLVIMRRLTWRRLIQAAKGTARTSVMVFTVVIATQFFSRFLVLTDVPQHIIETISDLQLSTWQVMAMICVVYLFLGMILDTIGMVLLTLPFVFPIILELGVDPILFGVILTVMCEVALITPPVGLNCYILNQVAPEVSLVEIFAGVIPFVIISLLSVIIFYVFPSIVLWLPRLTF